MPIEIIKVADNLTRIVVTGDEAIIAKRNLDVMVLHKEEFKKQIIEKFVNKFYDNYGDMMSSLSRE